MFLPFNLEMSICLGIAYAVPGNLKAPGKLVCVDFGVFLDHHKDIQYLFGSQFNFFGHGNSTFN